MLHRVCILEDEPIIRRGLIRSIPWDTLECRIVGEASDGVEGLRLIEKEKPDIIILDINMPFMTGIDVLEKLPRETYAVIIISGHTEFSYAKKAIEFGVTEYLLKPLDHNELIVSLKRAKQQVRMYRSLDNRDNNVDFYEALGKLPPIESVTLNIVLEYITNHYSEKITLDDLKLATGKSANSIVNRFQKHLSMTFNDYLTRYRIQKSLELMKSKKYHLYEISEMVGFSDYKYFNQVFNKVMGVSPKIVLTYFARSKE